ncbi:uncharacterized protein Z518_04992 [Rhinocladiella mackenziei CBS 650.93]|uniref:t-SNARE coiled-coil homology domain-containing protein n=1 Tax=Rhinocladiella mackenziei CBS 650.93 TaxID=1442369 RepID=A0A0D2IV49_9EURO|nr:uncharacterized protein Z518_04992 [Rhinocladiella mackenziei CBS 650.93]KIX07016.1 hypothetical protein Z518_04992 [Rhinocladiella mackenziei CBS 650.93]
MSYNNQGYDTYNPYANRYGGSQNNVQEGYGRPQLSEQYSGSHYGPSDSQQTGQPGGGYEMDDMNGADPNRILNACREINRAMDTVEADLKELEGYQQRYLNDTDTSAQSPWRLQIDRKNQEIMVKYRGLINRVKKIKSDRESSDSRNRAQVGSVERRLKKFYTDYQGVEHTFRRATEEQIKRQYRIVRPDASDAEAQAAVQNPTEQIFQQALIRSNNLGQVQAVQSNVASRHADIKKIEEQMIELAQLFQDLEALVVQQEPAVTQIEQRGEEVTEHVAKANTELEGAVTKARAARRKKWMCLGIVVLIIIIIVVVVVVVVEVTNN